MTAPRPADDWRADPYTRTWATTRCPCCGQHWPFRRTEIGTQSLGTCWTCDCPRVLAPRPPDDWRAAWEAQDHICDHFVTDADRKRAQLAKAGAGGRRARTARLEAVQGGNGHGGPGRLR